MNLLGASMPLQAHCFGAVVADVTAHPSMDVGVEAFTEAMAAALVAWLSLDVAAALGCGDGGGWLYGLKDPPPCGVLPSCASLPAVRAGWLVPPGGGWL